MMLRTLNQVCQPIIQAMGYIQAIIIQLTIVICVYFSRRTPFDFLSKQHYGSNETIPSSDIFPLANIELLVL